MPPRKRPRSAPAATSSSSSSVLPPPTPTTSADSGAPPTKKQATGKPVVWKIASWNVNGIRACIKNNEESFYDLIKTEAPDVLFLSEVKCTTPDNPVQLDSYGYGHVYWNGAKAKKGGYAGTAMFSKKTPVKVEYGLGEHDDPDSDEYEGRVITAEFDEFTLVHCYIPNSGQKLERLEWRTKTWDPAMLAHLKSCETNLKKPVIWCGDLNVAHLDIDVHDPKGNKNKTAGFTDAERENFSLVLKEGFVDLYRQLYPQEKDCYTYWGYRFQSRSKNKGWRLDYYVASPAIVDRLEDVRVMKNLLGSDHAPVVLSLTTAIAAAPKLLEAPE